MIDIGELLTRASSAAQDKPRATTPHDVLALTLLQTYSRHAEGNPFKPGDLVTPRRNHSFMDAGDPHVVLDVFPERVLGDTSYWPDMRLAFEAGGDIKICYGASLMFEPWTGAVADVS